jgi:hypothetical protein
MGFLIVFGAGIFLLGLAYAIWTLVVKRRDQGTGNWPRTEGRVTSSFLYEHERDTPQGIIRSFTPVIDYEYEVDGLMYASNRRNFLPRETKTYANRLDAESVIAKYTLDKDETIPVYYNPNNPKQAVLEIPRPQAHNAELWYGLTNVLCGIGVMVLGIILLP